MRLIRLLTTAAAAVPNTTAASIKPNHKDQEDLDFFREIDVVILISRDFCIFKKMMNISI